MSFRPYPNYKDSGVEWLGQVPAGWRVGPIRRFARLESGHTPSRSHPEYWQNCTVPWFTLADVWQIREHGATRVYETKERISELGLANSAARLLPAGTVMLSRTASVGLSAIMGIPMATTQDFANWVCGPELRPEFLLYVMRAMAGEFERLKMGSTHNTIYMPDIQSLRIGLPSVQEQQQIERCLDVETAGIDRLISEQQRLIALLKEKRQAVISHAVTNGLNPDAPMKPSGIDWLGNVPGHWTVRPLKHVARVGNGSTPSRDQPTYWTEGTYPWLNSAVVNQDRVHQAEQFVTERALAECHLPQVTPPAVLIGLTGQGPTRGKASTLLIEATVSQHLAFLKPTSEQISVRWLRHVLDAAYDALRDDSGGGGSTKGAITCEQIGNFKVPLPPVDEQTAILSVLDWVPGRIDALGAQCERVIGLLQERRTALISAAVTGQIDVRGLVQTEVA